MRSGSCPKCRSSEVYRNPSGARLSFKNGRALQDAYFDTYVCLGCGYMEMYADLKGDDVDPAEIRKHWKKAR